MTRLENYLAEYSLTHQNKTNQLIHFFCVPLIMFSVIGILKALPVPESWPLWLDFSTLAIALVLGFYASFKKIKLFLAMLFFIIPQVLVLEYLRPRFLLLCLVIFIFAWIAQFIGHKIEGKKPAFFKDIFFLLIGPLWVVKHFYDFNNAKDT